MSHVLYCHSNKNSNNKHLQYSASHYKHTDAMWAKQINVSQDSRTNGANTSLFKRGYMGHESMYLTKLTDLLKDSKNKLQWLWSYSTLSAQAAACK